MPSVDSTESVIASDPADAQRLNECRIVFIGKLGSMNRKDARELVRKHGGIVADKVDDSVNMVVIGADQFSPDQHDELLEDSVIAAASNGQVEILSETQLWQRLAMVDPDLEVGQLYTPAMLAQSVSYTHLTLPTKA